MAYPLANDKFTIQMVIYLKKYKITDLKQRKMRILSVQIILA